MALYMIVILEIPIVPQGEERLILFVDVSGWLLQFAVMI